MSDSLSKFEESYVSVFMGGQFSLKDIKTLGELKQCLKEWIKELDGWGSEDSKLSECLIQQKLIVTLENGIYQ